MTSDQFSDKPLPPSNKKFCPYCGEDIPAGARACWLCLEKYAIQEGAPVPSRRDRSAPDEQHRAGDSAAWAAFGVVALFLIGALALETPGVLIVLVILAAPAMARALVSASRQSDEAAPARTPGFILLFLNSLGIAAVVGIASFVAFFATCFVICLGVMSSGALNKGGSEDMLFTCSIGGGAVVGLIVFGLLFRQFWPKKLEP